jgi:hypothetical protein
MTILITPFLSLVETPVRSEGYRLWCVASCRLGRFRWTCLHVDYQVAACSFETSAINYYTTQRHVPEDNGLCSHHRLATSNRRFDRALLVLTEDLRAFYSPERIVGLYLDVGSGHFPSISPCIIIFPSCSALPLRWPRDTLYPLKLALTSPTSGGRSVGIVRSRTKATEFGVV